MDPTTNISRNKHANVRNAADAYKTTHQSYRADIDGLRAAAILSVIFFHAFPDKIRGGFVGVDIFFVISGFLISNILFRGFANNSFSFLGFYARRIRRIFPALITVLIASFLSGWFLLLSSEFMHFGKHLATSAGFVQNFLLWSESGYFDISSDFKPLMHLWSLAIEEQFYVVFPILLWGAWRMNIKFFGLISGGFIISFALNLIQTGQDAPTAFFLPHTRFWELLAGSLLAHQSHRFRNTTTLVRNILSICGVLLILSAVLCLDKNTSFPGWWALLPIGGAVSLIQAGQGAWINKKILSSKYMVFIGAISYPLYLWHWPLFAFARITEGKTLSCSLRISLVVLSFFLAWGTYQFIERHIRFGRKAAWKIYVPSMAIVGLFLIGVQTYRVEGYMNRGIQERLGGFHLDPTHLSFFKYIEKNFAVCTPKELREEAIVHLGTIGCAQTYENKPVSAALIGDSHAEHLFIGLAEALKGKQNLVYYFHKCLPFVGLSTTEDCRKMSRTIDHILLDPDIKIVILANHWSRKWASENTAGQKDTSDFKEKTESAMLETLDKLTKVNKKIYLIDNVPQFPFSPEKCFGRWGKTKKDGKCFMEKDAFLQKTQKYRPRMQDILNKYPNAQWLYADKSICDDEMCWMVQKNVLYYRDSGHLSIEGSKIVGTDLVTQMSLTPETDKQR